MVQIVEAPDNFAKTFGRGVGAGLGQGFTEAMQRKQQAKAMEAENEQLKRMGIDLSGIQNPKLREVALGQMLQGQQKEGLLQQKMNAFQQMMGGGQGMGGEQQGMQEQQPQMGFDPLSLSDEDIVQATAIDPNIGKALQHAKDVSSRERTESYKVTQPYRDEILNQHQSFKNDQAIQERMRALNKKDLTKPLAAKLASVVGIPLGALGNPNSEEYEKLVQEKMKGISKVYKGRILQTEFENYLRGIPTLMNSKEGRETILDMQDLLNKPKEFEYEEYKKILKEYKGQALPLDLREQIQERMDPKLDEWAREFGKLGKKSEAMQRGYYPMYDADGDLLHIPVDKYEEALKDGLFDAD